MSARKKRPRITAAELTAQLATDPEYQAKFEESEAVLAAQAEIWRHTEKPMLRDLRAAGYEIESVWDSSTLRRHIHRRYRSFLTTFSASIQTAFGLALRER